MKRLAAWGLCMLLCLSLGACALKNEPAPGENRQSAPAQTGEEPAFPTSQRDPVTGAFPEMESPDFWIALDETAGEVRMTEEERLAYNRALAERTDLGMCSLEHYPDTRTGTAVAALMQHYGDRPSGSYYVGSQPITAAQQAAVRDNMDLAGLVGAVEVRFGFVTESFVIRCFPWAEPLYSSPEDREFDMGVETRLKLWEPVAVLADSADGEWYFVQSYNSVGWIPQSACALCPRETWDGLRTRLDSEFLLVTGARIALDGSAQAGEEYGRTLTLGTRLPLHLGDGACDNAAGDRCYVVELPHRREDGQLTLTSARIMKNEDVSVGYLPFTTENLLEEAFRLLGHRYGWGGMWDCWDCSSLVQDVYQTMGIFLPRNSTPQGQLPGGSDVSALSDEEKLALLAETAPGALLEMPGHQTVFLGLWEGEAYVLHATYGIVPWDKSGGFYPANSVIVSSAGAGRRGGGTILSACRNICAVG